MEGPAPFWIDADQIWCLLPFAVQDNDVIPLLIACMYWSRWMLLELGGGSWERGTLLLPFFYCNTMQKVVLTPAQLVAWRFALHRPSSPCASFCFTDPCLSFKSCYLCPFAPEKKGLKYLEITLTSLLGLTVPSMLPLVTPAGSFLPFQGSLLNNKVFNGHCVL